MSTSHVTSPGTGDLRERHRSRSKTGTRGKSNLHANSSFPKVYGPTVYSVDTCVCNDSVNLVVFGAEGAPLMFS